MLGNGCVDGMVRLKVLEDNLPLFELLHDCRVDFLDTDMALDEEIGMFLGYIDTFMETFGAMGGMENFDWEKDDLLDAFHDLTLVLHGYFSRLERELADPPDGDGISEYHDILEAMGASKTFLRDKGLTSDEELWAIGGFFSVYRDAITHVIDLPSYECEKRLLVFAFHAMNTRFYRSARRILNVQ